MRTLDDTEQLLKLQRRLTIALLSVALLFVIWQVSGYFADLLRILGISFVLAYLYIGAVDFLQKYINNRAVCVALVYTTVLAATIISAIFVIPAMVYQVTSLISSTVSEIPTFLKTLEQALIPLQERFNQIHMDVKVIDVITNFVAQAPKPDPGALVGRVSEMAMSTMTWSVFSVSISVVSFYLLLDGHRMNRSVIALFPKYHEKALQELVSDIDRSLQSFFKGQVVLGLLFGVVMLVVYVILGVQYALLLSVFLALCEILPVIGPPIGFAPALVAVAVHGSVLPGARFLQILILTAIFMILQQVKDSVVGPRYIGNVIGLHPILIFIAIMVGGRVDGILGIILAIPAACAINVVVLHLPRLLSMDESVAEASSGGPNPGPGTVLSELDETNVTAEDSQQKQH